MLRHYDSLGLVRPTGRTVGGYRDYTDEDVRKIFHVESLRSLGLSLNEIGRVKTDPAFTPSGLVGDLIRLTRDRLEREQELLDSPSTSRGQQAALAQSAGAQSEETPMSAEVLAGAILAEPDPNVAGALCWALARSAGDALATLTAGTRSDDVDVRRRAVRAISELPDVAGATAILAGALSDPDLTVRRHAALVLGWDGDEATIPILIDMVVEGVNDVDAAEVVVTLSRDPVCESGVTTALVNELARHTGNAPVRIRLARELLELPGTAAQDVLRELTRDHDRAVALVASAFVRIRDERAPMSGEG